MAAVTAIPYFRFYFRFAAARPDLPGARETAAAVIAVLGAILTSARLQRRCSRTELVLASVLAPGRGSQIGVVL